MTRDKWIWMPHAGHFIGGHNCKFRLNTYVGKYIVSTVGELLWDTPIREITARCRGIELEGIGDAREVDYMKKIGFEDIGWKRKYETMVFKAKKSKHKCCLYEIIVSKVMESNGYNQPEDAYKGHLELCNKWSKK